MANCDMCGFQSEKLNSVKVEGTTMNVCNNCTKYGEKIQPSLARRSSFKQKRKEEQEEVLVENYSQLIKSARESKNMKQCELAKELNEKESLIHQIESGHFRPRLTTTKKIERFLKIKLLKKFEKIEIEKHEVESEGLTIGDLIKKKMK